MNIAVLLFASIFVIAVIVKIVINYFKRRKQRRNKKRLFGTQDLTNILFNVGLFTAGTVSILISLGYGQSFFGTELSIAQPIINFLAGVLFIWFAIRNIFYEGKI